MRGTFFICIAVSVDDGRLIAAPARVPVRSQPISGETATKQITKSHPPCEAAPLILFPAAQRLRSTKSLERTRAGHVSCQGGRAGPPASLSSVVGPVRRAIGRLGVSRFQKRTTEDRQKDCGQKDGNSLRLFFCPKSCCRPIRVAAEHQGTHPGVHQ